MSGTRINLALCIALLLAVYAQEDAGAQGWDCRQGDDGSWICAGAAPGVPVPSSEPAAEPPPAASVPRDGKDEPLQPPPRPVAPQPPTARTGSPPGSSPREEVTRAAAAEPEYSSPPDLDAPATEAQQRSGAPGPGETEMRAAVPPDRPREPATRVPGPEVGSSESESVPPPPQAPRPRSAADRPKDDEPRDPAYEAAPALPEAAPAPPIESADDSAEPAPAPAPDAPTAGQDGSAAAPVGESRPAETDAPIHPDLSRLDAGLSWDYCGPPPAQLGPLTLPPQPEAGEPIEISADAADLFHLENRAELRGAVVVDRGSQHLETDLAVYDRDAGTLETRGETLLQQPGLRVLGQRTKWDLIRRQGSIEQAHYRLTSMNARGSADRAELESTTLSHFHNMTYTSCPRGSNAWALQAERLDVDQAAGEAVARHAKLRVGGVPILYTPYLSLPLDDRRKTGLLLPSFGNSTKLGLDVRVPYYLNLAPDMDATLTPRFMSKRGVMLGGEFRYLTPSERGLFKGEIIPDDREYQDGDMRGGFSFNQQGRFGPNWATNVTFNLVSDDTYLEDFGQNLQVTSTRYLERRGDLLYQGQGWYALGRLQGFQTVDPDVAPEDRPYERLPQLLFGGRVPGLWGGTEAGLDAENVYFSHSDKVQGNRLAFHPWISLPLRRSYGHLTPKAALNHASYWLTDQAAGLPNSPSSTLPTLSLDGGLTFERELGWLGTAATQTLEPRLFYLYTPYQDQDDFPAFDTAELDFSFASLFRENRFTGRDRIGDANQLTLALTSRSLQERDGRELFRASLGQVLFFKDRRVQLQGDREDSSNSAVAGEVAARLSDRWSSRASVLWDPNRGEDEMRKTGIGLHYRSPEHRLVNLSYRLNRSDQIDDTDFEDTDLSFRWPVNPRLELVGRWLYSLRNDQTLEAFAGIEYGRCCWRTRLIVRNFVTDPDEDPNLSVMLQVELAGLGAFGSTIEDFLERGVYGYAVE